MDNRSVMPTPDEDWVELARQVRNHNTAEIKKVLAALEPYVDGSFGAINPAHVRTYLEALKQLGQLWRVFDRPEERTEAGVDEQLVLESRRSKVLAQLEEIKRKER
jgi:hypothetical protein